MNSSPPLQQDVHLIDYLRVIHKRRFFVTFVVVAALGGTIFQTLRTPRVYQSMARILVENETTIVDFPGVRSYQGLMRLPTEMHVVRSREVAENAVLNKLELVSSREDPAFQAHVNRLIASISVKQVPSSFILELSCRAGSPKLAQDYCAAVAESYAEQNYEARKQIHVAGARAIHEQINKAEKDLELAESQFMAFKMENQIISERRKDQEQDRRFSVAAEARLNASIKADEARNKARALKAWYDKGDPSYLSASIAPDSPANRLWDDILKKRAEVGSYREKYTEKHPKLNAAVTELRQLEDAFDTEIRSTIDKLNREATYFRSNEAAHAQRATLEKADQLRQNELDWQYNLYRRQVESKEAILRTLRQKLEEVNVATSIVKNNVRIIERPQYLPTPIRPRTRFNLIVGLVFGLGLGLVGAFFLEYLDKSLKTPDDIDRYLALPVLAVIPKVREDLLKAPYSRPQLPEGETA